jgi:hypothetical protein
MKTFALQAIETKYHGASDRISATTAAGRKVFVAYDHGLSVADAHAVAAQELAESLDWVNPTKGFAEQFRAGSTVNGYVFVNLGY